LPTQVVVGLNYTFAMESNILDFGDDRGQSSGRQRNIDSFFLRVVDTVGLITEGFPLLACLSTGATPQGVTVGQANPLFSGVLERRGQDAVGRDGSILLTQAVPFPAHILSLNSMVTIDD
jgi:hypothetical protein